MLRLDKYRTQSNGHHGILCWPRIWMFRSVCTFSEFVSDALGLGLRAHSSISVQTINIAFTCALRPRQWIKYNGWFPFNSFHDSRYAPNEYERRFYISKVLIILIINIVIVHRIAICHTHYSNTNIDDDVLTNMENNSHIFRSPIERRTREICRAFALEFPPLFANNSIYHSITQWNMSDVA